MAKGFHAKSTANLTFTDRDVTIMSVGNGFVCLSGSFLLVHAIIQICYLPLRRLIWELELLLNLISAGGAIFISIYLLSFVATDYFGEEYYHLHHLSSWVVLIAWTNIMLLLGRLPQLGCYSLMLATVTKNFLKVGEKCI